MDSTINIRHIQKSDNKALALIIRNCFTELNIPTEGTVFTDPTTDNLFTLFNVPNAILWVAVEDDIVLGCCGVYPTSALPTGCVELVKFYLDPVARGKKIGKALFEKSLESALQLEYKSVYIESFPQFSEAIKMYKKFGFTYLTNPLGNSGHFGCNIWMLKQL
jgi:putative acetyltransferase